MLDLQPKSFQDWLHWMESQHPETIELGLERVEQVAHQMGFAGFNHPVIIVAGTNGKGSVVALLESNYHAQGYRVGTYTSPHLRCYRERVKINKQCLDESDHCEGFDRVDKARHGIPLTFFEFGTLAALDILKRHQLDVAILEIGLGGRLDAVNIVSGDVAIITNVDYDHQSWLGNDLESIGFEKSGIFRQGQTAIFGDEHIPQSVIQRAKDCDVNLYRLGDGFSIGELEKKMDGLPNSQLQPNNIATALMAVDCLQQQLPVSPSNIKQGCRDVSIQGRLQSLENPSRILDVCHNPAACEKLAEHLKSNPINGKTYGVVGMYHDKDHVACFTPLLPYIDEWSVATLSGDRGTEGEQLKSVLTQLNVEHVNSMDNVTHAYHHVMEQLTDTDRMIVFGSFQTVSEVLALVEE